MSNFQDRYPGSFHPRYDVPPRPRSQDSGWKYTVPKNSWDNAQNIYHSPPSNIVTASTPPYPHGHYAVPFVLAAIVYLWFQPLLWNCIRYWILRYARFCQRFGNCYRPAPISFPPPLCPNTDHSDLEETRILILEHRHHFLRMLIVGLFVCCILPGAGSWRAIADYGFQLLVVTAVLPFVLAFVVPLRLSVGPMSFWAGLVCSLWTGLCGIPHALVACIPFRTILAIGAAILSWQAIGPYMAEALLLQLIKVMWWMCLTMKDAAIRLEIQALAAEELSYSWAT